MKKIAKKCFKGIEGGYEQNYNHPNGKQAKNEQYKLQGRQRVIKIKAKENLKKSIQKEFKSKRE